MNAFEYLKLLREREVVEQADSLIFRIVSGGMDDIVFFESTAEEDDWQEGDDFFYLDWCNIDDGEEKTVYTQLRLRTPEDVRFILEHLEGEFEIDKSLLVF